MSNKLGVKVRGVYSTALSKLFLDQGFLIVEPSLDIQERLGIEDVEVEPDLMIEDKQIKHTIFLTGKKETVKTGRAVIASSLEESIFFEKTNDVIEVDFPLSMKRRLDELRRQVVPTLDDHHYYKVFGYDVKSALDMAENLLKEGRPRDEVVEKFRRTITPYLPFEGSQVDISHVKLNGHVIDLGAANIITINDGTLVFEREMKSDGVYDGLNVEKKAGDKAISKTSNSDYYIETKYYSSNGNLRGTYLNINTPVEVYSSYIRYIDLDVDVVIWPDGRAKIIDEAYLDKAESLGVVTSRLADKTRAIADDLLDSYT